MLDYESRKTCAIRTVFGSCKTFKPVRNGVRSILKYFSIDLQKRLMRSEIQLDFKKPGQANQTNGLFTEIGLTEMLEHLIQML